MVPSPPRPHLHQIPAPPYSHHLDQEKVHWTHHLRVTVDEGVEVDLEQKAWSETDPDAELAAQAEAWAVATTVVLAVDKEP